MNTFFQMNVDFGNLGYALFCVILFLIIAFVEYVAELIIADIKKRIRRYLRKKGY